jgi:hypothetical protein
MVHLQHTDQHRSSRPRCEHTFVPGSPYPQSEIGKIVDRAVAEGDADRALRWAQELKQVDLHRALALTLVLGRQDDVRYPRAASRFLLRLITAVEPSLLNLKKIVDALDVVGRVRLMPDVTEGADAALEDLGRQLRERGEGLQR